MLGIGQAMINQITRNNTTADRQLFTFLNAEGAALERDKMVPYVRFDDNPPEKQRRAQMTPEQRATLEFLEEAKSKLDDIERSTVPGSIDGRAFVARLKYINSLPVDKRTLLEKVEKEGAYPFARPPRLQSKGPDSFMPRRSEAGAEAITDMRNLARRGLTASAGWLR